MVAGHFGFAAVVKSRERQTPLWALMLACQWLDVVFVPLFVLGIERITPVPGTSGGYGQVIITADYTHSLVGALALAVLFGLVSAMPWGWRNGVVLGAVVFSHWCLDLVVHRGDIPLLPGNAGRLPRVGFGLWQMPAASIVVELALIAVGSLLYWRAALATAHSAGERTSAAHVAGALIVVSGLITLTLDVLGI
jgi:hypothetical protein